MNTLFGQDVIKSIGFNEGEILKNIFELHCPDGIELDPCFSIGNFYKQNGIKKPKYMFDLTPRARGVVQGRSNSLPVGGGSIKSIMFDPPFVIGGADNDEIKDGSNIISRRFTNFQSFDELKEMYSTSLAEFSRVLIDGGVVIFKCQDVVSSSLNHFTHCWVMYEAMKYGFYPKDLFILLVKNRILGGNHKIQQHARKFHCYYWVFTKEKCKIKYTTP